MRKENNLKIVFIDVRYILISQLISDVIEEIK